MSLVKGKNTKTEMVVRSLIHRLGYRYRLHGAHLPGRPDLIFSSRRKVVFIHGCFWHRHKGCKLARLPKSRCDFWIPKLEGNRKRDIKNQRALRKIGWKYLVIWECEITDAELIRDRVRAFLGNRCEGIE